MKLLKFFRKPYFSIFMAFTFLLFSCSRYDNDLNTENQKFDYTIYKSFNNTNFNKYFAGNLNLKASTTQTLTNSINLINNDFQTNLQINPLDNQLILNKENNSSDIKSFEIIQNSLTSEQRTLINNFENNIINNDFQYAINSLENEILSMNVSNEEFQKYNSFVNVLLLVDDFEDGYFDQQYTTNGLSPCAKAIIANALATIGLAACGTGIFCAVAIAAKILALDAVLENCAGKPFL